QGVRSDMFENSSAARRRSARPPRATSAWAASRLATRPRSTYQRAPTPRPIANRTTSNQGTRGGGGGGWSSRGRAGAGGSREVTEVWRFSATAGRAHQVVAQIRVRSARARTNESGAPPTWSPEEDASRSAAARQRSSSSKRRL